MRQGFQAVLRQCHDEQGTYNLPRFSVKNVLPCDSRIFTVVREGRVVELQEMLRSGEDSLRDHDEHGASLIFVSVAEALSVNVCSMCTKLNTVKCANAQSDMCPFLLQHGADDRSCCPAPWHRARRLPVYWHDTGIILTMTYIPREHRQELAPIPKNTAKMRL